MEMWFRNPKLYIRELAETWQGNLIWDAGFAKKNDIDVFKHADMNLPEQLPLRVIWCSEYGAIERRRGDTAQEPTAFYPVWDSEKHDLKALARAARRANTHIRPPDRSWMQFREGQEQRIMILFRSHLTNLPGRNLFREIEAVQKDFPDVIMHFRGVGEPGSRVFGSQFRSTDYYARYHAAYKQLMLPNGRRIGLDRAQKFRPWIEMLGYAVQDLELPAERCKFNIESSLWAAANFQRSDYLLGKEPTKQPFSTYRPARRGDKFLCDRCTLSTSCMEYRPGSVCTLPGADTMAVAKYFRSRNTDDILDGLVEMVGDQADRYDEMREREQETGEFDPQVTKMADSVIKNGMNVAKLLNPALVRPLVQINAGAGAAVAIAAGAETPPVHILVAAAMKELEAKGYPREDITDEMIERHIRGEDVSQPALPPVKEDEDDYVEAELVEEQDLF